MLLLISLSRLLLLTLLLIAAITPTSGQERAYEIDDGHAAEFNVDNGYEKLDGPERTHFGECGNCRPYPLPVRLTSVRNLQGEHWLGEMEVEITNISDKPIYYVRFGVAMPRVTGPQGKIYGFFLRYGRPELISFRELPGPKDVPIKPGESYVFRVPDTSYRRFIEYLTVMGQRESAIEKVLFRFDVIKFGDGTGYADGGLWGLHKVGMGTAPPQR